VGGGDDAGIKAGDGWLVPGDGFGARPVGMLAGGLNHRDVGVVVRNLGAVFSQQVHQVVGGRLALVIHVGFVSQADDQDFAAFEGLAVVVEGFYGAGDNVFGHTGIDFAGQLNEAGGLSVFAGFPGEVERVNGDAVAAEPGTRVERHKAKGLGFGRLNDFPDVYAHSRIDHLELVDQGDVDRAEDVFQELDRFGCAAGGDRDEGFDGQAVDFHGFLQAERGEAADDFGDVGHAALRVAGVFALGGKSQVEIAASHQARALLQDGAQVFVGGAGESGGFKDHDCAGDKVWSDGPAGFQDVRDVGLALLGERGRDADDDGVGGGSANERKVGGSGEAGGGEGGGDVGV